MKKKRIWYLSIIVYLVILFTLLPIFPVKAKAPSLSVKNLTFYTGEHKTLAMKNTDGKKVVWKSFNKSVATVSSKGVVKGKKAGVTTISATVKGKKFTCKVAVGDYLTSMIIRSGSSVILKQGQKSQIEVKLSPSTSLNKEVTYQCTDTKVATVSAKGILEGKTSGVATILVTSKGINKSKSKMVQKILICVLESSPIPTITPIPSVPRLDSTVVSATPDTKDIILKNAIDHIAKPEISQWEAAKFVVDYKGDKSTLHFMNPEYKGIMKILVNGISFSFANRTIVDAFSELETTYIVTVNSMRTLEVAHKMSDEWWTITDLRNNQRFQLRGWKIDTVFGTSYCLLVIKGDVTKNITVEGS